MATTMDGSRHARIVAGMLAIGAAVHAASARAADDLYAVTVIVTGRDNLAERARGIREALPLVLTRVSVDREAAARAVERGMADEAESLVVGLDYRDRKEGIQISDEQGTRDRSFELTVRFDPAAIDAMLHTLGTEPWKGPRPRIGIALTIEDRTSRYLMTATSEKGYGQRAAVEDGATALGLTVSLPEAEGRGFSAAPAARLDGEMTITASGYWDSVWRLEADGVAERFSFGDTTFDAAIEDALRRSAKALSQR